MRNSQMPYRQPYSNYPQPSHPMSMSYSQQLGPSSYYGQQPMQSRIEQIPYEKKTIDYYPQEKVEYIPQEQKYQDYLEVQHELDYVPVPRLEKYTDQVPIERYDTYYDYMPRQNTVVRSTGSNFIPPANQYQSYQYGPRNYGPQPYSYSNYGPQSTFGPSAFQNRPMTTPMGNFSQGYPAQPFNQVYPPFNQGRAPYYSGGSPYSGYSRYRFP